MLDEVSHLLRHLACYLRCLGLCAPMNESEPQKEPRLLQQSEVLASNLQVDIGHATTRISLQSLTAPDVSTTTSPLATAEHTHEEVAILPELLSSSWCLYPS
jgi:hypothetical protein